MLMRITLILLLFTSSLRSQELVQTDFEKGYVKDEKKVSVWQYFNSKKEPELVINHTTGRVMFISKDTTDYVILKNGEWVNSKLDVHPVPIEGSQNFYQAIRNAVNYTAKDFRNNIEGTVMALFEIDTTGSSINYSLAKSIGCECDSVVLQSLKTINQKWIPAKVGGKKYPSRFAIEIEFRLKLNETLLEHQEFTLRNAKLLTQITVVANEKGHN